MLDIAAQDIEGYKQKVGFDEQITHLFHLRYSPELNQPIFVEQFNQSVTSRVNPHLVRYLNGESYNRNEVFKRKPGKRTRHFEHTDQSKAYLRGFLRDLCQENDKKLSERELRKVHKQLCVLVVESLRRE